MRLALAAVVGGLLASAGSASAQGLEFRPINTDALVVQPTDAATNIVGGTVKYIGRAVADTISKDGIVRTWNSLTGRPTPTTQYQSGYSPLDVPGRYPSTRYQNSFVPAMPTYQQFGTTPRLR